MTTLALRFPRSIASPRNLQYAPPSSILKRYASTSSSATSSASPTTTEPLSLVNGPPTTLPAPLDLPTRDKSQSLFRHLLSTGKAYLSFYKTGGRNIWSNYRAAQALRRKHPSVLGALSSGILTRHDFQLLHRNQHDLKRVPIFALVFVVCGEFTPLVVVLVSSVVPWPCRLPAQIEGDRKTLEKRRAISFRNLTTDLLGEGQGVQEMERMQVLHINWSLGLSSSIWDWLGGQLPGLPTSVLRSRVRQRIKYLNTDDELINKDGGVESMLTEEVKMACVERGIDVVGHSEDVLRGSLKSWLQSRGKMSVENLLLTRPSVWPARIKNEGSPPVKNPRKVAPAPVAEKSPEKAAKIVL